MCIVDKSLRRMERCEDENVAQKCGKMQLDEKVKMEKIDEKTGRKKT